MTRLRHAAADRVGVTQRKLASKFGIAKSTIHYNLKKLGLTYYKRQKIPKYTEQQLQQIPKKCEKIRRQFTRKETFIIVNDEKCFTFSNNDMPQNTGFYTFDKEHASDYVKFKPKEKYEKKILVWLALSAKGISTPFIGTTKGPAVIADVYIEKCLSKLLTFIETYHSDNDYVCWPDLSTSHYGKKQHNGSSNMISILYQNKRIHLKFRRHDQ